MHVEELLQTCWYVAHFEVVVLSEIKIEQVALQNGIGAGVEDRDEFAGNKVGKKEYNDTW